MYKWQLVSTLLLIHVSYVWTNNYNEYMDRLAAESKAIHDEFLRANPHAHRVLKRYNSPSYLKRHPVLGEVEPGEHNIDRATWKAFVQELKEARAEASRESTGEEIERVPDWYEIEDDNNARSVDSTLPTQEAAASRRAEVAYQNQLWGDHKVSGGSGEIGQWLNYALLGAGSQDDEDDQMEDTNLPHDKWPSVGQMGHSQVKNASLPTYCNPPNPCPLGYDPGQMSTPCDRDTHFTMELNREWILNKIAQGECTCDTEHMNSCPQTPGTVSHEQSNGMDKSFMTEFRNPYLRGQKRKRLVAKKSFPRVLGPRYYYMHGKVLKKVVKKDGHSVM